MEFQTGRGNERAKHWRADCTDQAMGQRRNLHDPLGFNDATLLASVATKPTSPDRTFPMRLTLLPPAPRRLAAMALMSILTLPVIAQDDSRGERGSRERGRFGGPGGGPGGPGGGFGGPGGRGGPMGGPGSFTGGGAESLVDLLRRPSVQKELDLMADQTAALEEMQRRSREGRSRPDFDFRSADEEQRREFFEKMQAQRASDNQTQQSQLEEVLLPDQMQRLQQLALQRRGAVALADPTLQHQLSMRPEQTEALTKIQEQSANKIRETMAGAMRGEGDRSTIAETIRNMRSAIEADAMAVLSKSQREKLDELRGEPFEFPEAEEQARGGRGSRFGRGGD